MERGGPLNPAKPIGGFYASYARKRDISNLIGDGSKR